MPGIRPLAEQLRVNRNTVAKAYAELENQGVIATVAGKGCVVRTNASPFKKDVRRRDEPMSEQTPAIEPIDGPRSLMADVRVLIPALAPLLLWFGYVNHTRRERSLAPLLWQVVAIASVLAATIAISATRV